MNPGKLISTLALLALAAKADFILQDQELTEANETGTMQESQSIQDEPTLPHLQSTPSQSPQASVEGKTQNPNGKLFFIKEKLAEKHAKHNEKSAHSYTSTPHPPHQQYGLVTQPKGDVPMQESVIRPLTEVVVMPKKGRKHGKKIFPKNH